MACSKRWTNVALGDAVAGAAMVAQGLRFLFADRSVEKATPVVDHPQHPRDWRQAVVAARQAPILHCSKATPATSATKPAHAVASRYDSSMTNEANLPCHGYPSHPKNDSYGCDGSRNSRLTRVKVINR